jgi:hypothetical protein
MASSTPLGEFPLYPQPANTSLDPTLIKGLITGGVSGAVGLFFLLVKIYLNHQAQKKLNKMMEENDGVGKALADYQNNVIRPIARAIFDRIKITGFADYISDETMSEYFHAIETLAAELSRNAIIPADFATLPIQDKHRLIHEVAKQTKLVLIPDTASCCNLRFFRVCPEVTPENIEENIREITTRVSISLHGFHVDDDGARELHSIHGGSDHEGEPLQPRLLPP